MVTQSDCQRISEILSDYLDGELMVDRVSEVELHLEACAACARLEAELAATIDALRRLRTSVARERGFDSGC